MNDTWDKENFYKEFQISVLLIIWFQRNEDPSMDLEKKIMISRSKHGLIKNNNFFANFILFLDSVIR
jgi:hypothetical protein